MNTSSVSSVRVIYDGKPLHFKSMCSTDEPIKLVTESVKILRSLLPESYQMIVSERYLGSSGIGRCGLPVDNNFVLVTIVFPRQYSEDEVSQMKERVKEFSVYKSAGKRDYMLLETSKPVTKYGYFQSEEYKKNKGYIVDHLNAYAKYDKEMIRDVDIDYLVFSAYSSYPTCNYDGIEQTACSKAIIEREYNACNCSKEDIKQKMKVLISRDVDHSLLSIREEAEKIISSPYKCVIGDCGIVRSVNMETSDIVEKIYGALVHNIGSTLVKKEQDISQTNVIPRPVYETVQFGDGNVSDSNVSMNIFSNDIMKFPYTLSDFIRKWE